jgi:HPt (histidine-containing phosphotransfer) domain-containing protein
MDRAPLDWETARSRIGGSEEVLRDVAELFVAECPAMMEQIRAAIADVDHSEVRRTAHTLKGSAAVFVAEPTVAAAQRIEQMGEAQTLEGVDQAWATLEAEIERLLPELRRAAGLG